MTGERWTRLRDLFTLAKDLPEHERAAFLERETRGEPALRAELEAMLAGHASVSLQPFGFSRGSFRDLELFEEIGSGGMGVVYRARQTSLGRIVAVKVLRQRPGLAQSDVQRFREEARRVSQLRHPNIVAIHSVGQDDEPPHFVMEHVPGYSLHDLLEEARERRAGAEPGALPDLGPKTAYHARVAEILAAVADALEHAHREGIVHLDVKPSNVLLDDTGRVYLVDFGIAEDAQRQTRSRALMGTTLYMSPEQARQREVEGRIDHRTDVYSLGVVGYELLTLALPFEGETDEQVCLAIQDREPKPIRKVNPAVPRDLAVVCAKAMEKEADRRYASAADFARDLRRFLAGELPVARPPGLVRALRQRMRPHRNVLAVAALFVVLSATAVATWIWRERRHTLGSVSVRAAPRSSTVATAPRARVLAVDPGSGLPSASARWEDIGPAPLDEVALDPGTYKLSLDDDGGRWIELLVVVEPGLRLDLGAVQLHASSDVLGRNVIVDPARGEEPAMARIPASTLTLPRYLLQIGGSKDEQMSLVTIEVEPFSIDRYEVTNGEYREFMAATGHRAPSYWSADHASRWSEWVERGIDRLPVTGVDFADAEAYARWAGKRLPTPIEWLRAATGPEGSTVGASADGPTGEEAPNTREQRAEDRDSSGWERYVAHVDRVGARARDVSPEGVHDLAGNVREWTALPPIQSEDPRAFSREQRIVAGASFDFHLAPPSEFQVATAVQHGPDIGFRCVRPER